VTRQLPPASVRRAVPADVDTLAGIDRSSWLTTYRGLVPDAILGEWVEESPGKWSKILAEPPADAAQRIWVAEREGQVLGYATTSPAKDWWLPPPDGAGELTNLYLDPDAIGTGLGHLLYDHAMADLHARGFDPLLVWAFRDNPLARGFYDRMGLSVDVPDHDWVLGDVSCPIVRYRLDRPAVERA
jgi:ribosomal protein S18 acetylase RimI-like enzyme